MNFRPHVLLLATLTLIIAILAISFMVTSQSRNLAQNGISTFEENMLQAKQSELVHYVHMAQSSIAQIYDNATPYDLEAQEKVKQILTTLSYSEDGYFFVYDFDGNNLVHPKQTFRIGKNWIGLTDPNGDRVIENLINVAKAGGGFHSYAWEKPSTSEIAEKLSYAVALPKWGWMLGTGLYVDDIVAQTATANSELKSSIDQTFFLIAIITLVTIIAVYIAGLLLNLRERTMNNSKLKELTQRIIDTQEEERTRIARELHDGISQNLIGVRYVLDLAKHKVETNAGDALATIERGATNLGTAIKEVRRISHDLRPGILDDLGLRAAIEELTKNFTQDTGINVKVTSTPFKNLLPQDAKTALYRVAQEALTNIERHSKASIVTIAFTTDPKGIAMIITDNGIGLNRTTTRNKKAKTVGLGLKNMQERMLNFSGSLTLNSNRNGTVLRAFLPRSVCITPTHPAFTKAAKRQKTVAKETL